MYRGVHGGVVRCVRNVVASLLTTPSALRHHWALQKSRMKRIARSRTATLNASLKIRLFKKSKNPTLKIIYFPHGLALALAALH